MSSTKFTALIVILMAVSCALIVYCTTRQAHSAEYIVRLGDGWTRITENVSVPELKYEEGTLKSINSRLGDLRPGQKVFYLSLDEKIKAVKWVELCIGAGYSNKAYYRKDKKDLASGKINAGNIRRFVNYAEAYRLGVRPVPAVDLTKLKP